MAGGGENQRVIGSDGPAVVVAEEIARALTIPSLAVDSFGVVAWPDGAGFRLVMFETAVPSVRMPRGCVALTWAQFDLMVATVSETRRIVSAQLAAADGLGTSGAKH